MFQNKVNGQHRQRSWYMCVMTLLVVVSMLPYETAGNNNPPVIRVKPASPSSRGDKARISERAWPQVVLASVYVTDDDVGQDGNTTCNVVSEYFVLNPLKENEYMIQVLKMIDRETTPTIYVEIVCQDQGNPPLSTRLMLNVEIVDDNDNAPEFTKSVYNFSVKENAIGAQAFYVHATDKDIDRNAEITYSLISVNENRVTVDPQNGTIVIQTRLNYEVDRNLNFTVRATDGGFPSLSSEAVVVITIEDVNGQPVVAVLSKELQIVLSCFWIRMFYRSL